MKTCVFVGPSAGDVALPKAWDRFAPATQGSVFLAVETNYDIICLVDGFFGNVPSVWHKEVLYAISKGCLVFGASSMGALRAAELCAYGMIGVGSIFRFYRSGVLADDDEVCVLHAVREMHFVPLSFPMISIRRTMRMLNKNHLIKKSEEEDICRILKQVHFADRSKGTIDGAFAEIAGTERGKTIRDHFFCHYEDLKVRDFRELVHRVENHAHTKGQVIEWANLVTSKWLPQFVNRVADIPPLQAW